MQEKSEKIAGISARIEQIIKNEQIRISAFARTLGYDRAQTLYDIMNGKSAPSYDFFSKFQNSEYSARYDVEWLISGKGEMLKNNKTYIHDFLDSSVVSDYGAGDMDGKIMKLSGKTLPLYDMKTGIGLRTLFEKSHQPAVDFITIPHITNADGAISITGDNMYPILKSGDIVVYKRINNPENLIPGQIYLLVYEIEGDEHAVITYVNKAEKEGFFQLASYNRYHQPIDIPICSIRAIALVKASIRYHSMG